MASSQIAIIIPDDEEALGLEQGHSRPQRAPRRDYSYQGWEDTMDNAAASDDTNDDATTYPARKRRRSRADGESITSIVEDTIKKLQKTFERKIQRLQQKLCDSYHENQKLREELRDEQECHRKVREELHQTTQRRIFECAICFRQPDRWVTLLCGHLFCKNCTDEWRGRSWIERPERPDTCPNCREPIKGYVECNPYAG